jgi:metallo-beta-lactamase class B
MERGTVGSDDPQYGLALAMPRVSSVEVIRDRQTVTVGSTTVTAWFTGGHTPGGTTWSWQSCEAARCLTFVYADSQTPVSRDDFRFSDSEAYPTAVADFERGFAVLESVPCDVLITPHPGASSLWDRISSGIDGLIDASACKRYAALAREQLQRRLTGEAR